MQCLIHACVKTNNDAINFGLVIKCSWVVRYYAHSAGGLKSYSISNVVCTHLVRVQIFDLCVAELGSSDRVQIVSMKSAAASLTSGATP